jgi:hypothetical protein
MLPEQIAVTTMHHMAAGLGVQDLLERAIQDLA